MDFGLNLRLISQGVFVWGVSGAFCNHFEIPPASNSDLDRFTRFRSPYKEASYLLNNN